MQALARDRGEIASPPGVGLRKCAGFAITSAADIVVTQREHREMTAVRIEELNLHSVGIVELEHGALGTCGEPMLGDGAGECDDLEELGSAIHVDVLSGKAVTRRGMNSPCRTIQIVRTFKGVPKGPMRTPATRHFTP
jgi:hypothetical protein